MKYVVYLSGEIHTDWRDQIIAGAKALNLPVEFTSAVTDHEASDAAGDVLPADVPAEAKNAFWRDHKSSKVNAIRTRVQLEKCDVAIIRFGDKYKQWNAAFDAGYPLKEVDAAALAWAQTPQQVVEVLSYVTLK